MAKIKFRRDTAANWLDANPTLAQGEPGFEHDTGLLKIGDGSSTWSQLDYSSGAIPNTKKGWINLVGDRPNNQDDVWFESVVVEGNYAYVAGSDYYIAGSNNLSKIYKFDVRTGEQLWVRQIVAGRGAEFTFLFADGVVTIDAITLPGLGYKVGEELHFQGWRWEANPISNLVTVVVNTVDEGGEILTASIKPGYNVAGIAGTVTGQVADNNNARGNVSSISYDRVNDVIVVVSEYESGLGNADWDQYYTWANIYLLNSSTGNVVQTVTLTAEGDIYPNSLKLTGTEGDLAIVGEKYGEFRQFGTLTMLASYNGYFDILKSNIDAEHYPGSPYDNYGDFWVSGTGIASVNNVDNVNYYPNVSGTVRQGTGAEFVVNDNGDGTYADATSITPTGSNYVVGHKIKILGTSLGGSTPANDAIITVASVDAGAITTYTITGTAAGSVVTPYSGVTGTNYNVGQFAEFNIGISSDGVEYVFNGIANTGLDYVPGDVITVLGTSFAGGSSPANDVVVTVSGTNTGNGNITNVSSLIGTPNANAIRVFVDGVDFSVEGSWSMKQNLGGEAFVWTPLWSNAIGGPSGDRFYDVCYSRDGASIFAVGRGRYETTYDQALVVKFNAGTGAVVWGKDIKFTEATDSNRQARAVCLVPGSSDLIVAGAWYNNNTFVDELIITRITEAGVAVWQKTYTWNNDGSTLDIDYELNLSTLDNGNIVVSMNMSTPYHSRGLGYLIIDASGAVVLSRVLSADGNSNYNYYDTPTSKFADVGIDADGNDYVVMAGYTYVPTDNYYNALLFKLPLDGYKDLAAGEWVSLGEHILGRYNWDVTTVTPAFDSFTATEHVNTFNVLVDQRDYVTIPPAGELEVWTYTITDDSQGFLEFGDGSRQSFATNLIPQIPAANDYYLTEQDSGKHIFFEHENGSVYIPHWSVKDLPVGFTFTIVNTAGNNCYVTCESANMLNAGQLKLAGRNISTYTIGIPDSGTGSMVTFLKVKSGYKMLNSDGQGDYADVWMVSGPGDLYNAD